MTMISHYNSSSLEWFLSLSLSTIQSFIHTGMKYFSLSLSIEISVVAVARALLSGSVCRGF
jgi:hypothetical protein